MEGTPHIHPSASVGNGCVFGFNVVIGENCKIGDGVVFHNNVTLYPGVEIGDGCEIFDNACIGRPPRTCGNTVHKLKPEYAPAKIGKNCVIGVGAVIYAETVLGDRVLVGDCASLREQCSVGDEAVIASYVMTGHHVKIGRGTKVMNYSNITNHAEIGPDVFVGVGVVTVNDNAMRLKGSEVGGAGGQKISSGAKIGSASVILPGVEIGSEAIVGAASLINKNLKARTFSYAQPAKNFDPGKKS